MNDDVARIAAAQMGVPAPEAREEAAEAGMRSPAAEAREEKQEHDTAQDKAAEQGSPDTEGDKSGADPVIYDIPMGDKTRKMTPQQIADTMGRYAELNFKQAQYKPVLDTIAELAKETGAKNPGELASHLKALAAANKSNMQMGNTEGDKSGDNTKTPSQGQTAEDISAALAKWEEDNAVSLPPGYKEMIANSGQQTTQMQGQMQQMQQMLQAVLARSGGNTDAARAAMQQAQGQQVQNIQRQIANNIDRVQEALKIPDEAANDFMVFAAERGFTLEDFVSPELTIRVMQDFKNQMDSPEMERMRNMAQRRQAYTGSMGSTPTAGGAPASQGAPSAFDKMAEAAMKAKGF